MSSRAQLEKKIQYILDSIGHIRILGNNFEFFYIVDAAFSIYLYLVLRRSVLMKVNRFRTHFSYFRLSRICGNIHLT